MKSRSKDKDQVVPGQTLPFQGDLPCHASNASNKAFSKAVSEPSRCGHILVTSCPDASRPRVVLGRALSRSLPGG